MPVAARVLALLLILSGLAALPVAAQAPAPVVRDGKPGGILRMVLREDLPQGFSIHETATNSVTWPSMPCYSNLVVYDQTKRFGRMDTIVPELAEKWSWQDNYRNLVFFLRKDVKWHDGQPFTSKDVKFTFDTVREAADAPAKLRINPRKEWYANVDAVEAPDPYTVVFRLKRPQPSLVAMLASGYSPVIPAHVPIPEHRSRCIGTGPFKFKEWKRGQTVELVRNPDYFVKGRPYLDAVRYTVIVERGTRVAALQANQIDVAYPGETTLSIAEQLKGAVPSMVFTETASNVSENLLLNTKKPPFDNVKVRRALSFAIDRRAYTQTVHRGAAVVGASLAPKPWGVWGLLDKDLARSRATAGRRRAAPPPRSCSPRPGSGRATPSRSRSSRAPSRSTSTSRASWSATSSRSGWRPRSSRSRPRSGTRWSPAGSSTSAPTSPASESTIPTRTSTRTTRAGLPRNYGDYCNEEVTRLIDQQSQEIDQKKRLALVWQIQKKLEEDAARPTMGWRTDRFAHYPYVKNLIPNQVTYNCCRLQEVWLDK